MERKERPGVMLYFDVFRPLLNRLDNEKSGQLLRAVIDYAECGEVHDDLDPLTGMAFDLIRPKIDHDAEKYEESREQRQYAVYCREKQKAGEPCLKISEWRLSRYAKDIGPISPDNGKNGSYLSTSISPAKSIPSTSSAFISTTDAAKPPRPAFSPPSLEEVQAYCRERGNEVDAQRFVDYYGANGWKVGKNPMKDWKAAVRTWENNDYDTPKKSPKYMSSRQQKPLSSDEWDKIMEAI